jgi:hypothetical protein
VCCASTPNRCLSKVREGTELVRLRTHIVVATLSAVCTAPSSAADCCDDGTESFLYLHTKY